MDATSEDGACIPPDVNELKQNEPKIPDLEEKVESNDSQGVPLNTRWTFWTDKSERGASAAEYAATLGKIYTVRTVQGFWSVFNNIPKVNELSQRYTYHLMREDHRPLWEDDYHCHGGTWRLKVAKHDSILVWKELVLAAIGEQFADHLGEGDDICGVSITIRDKFDIVQVWNKDASLEPKATVLDKMQQLLPDCIFLTKFYKPHHTHLAYEGDKKMT